jgi:hypothetical protein
MDLQTPAAGRTAEDDGPLPSSALAERPDTPAGGAEGSTRVTLLDVALDERVRPQVVREDGRLRVVADVGVDGLDVTEPFPPARATALEPSAAGRHRAVLDLAGHRPSGVGASSVPAPAPPVRRSPHEDGGVSRTIFGTDDRVVFQDTTYPWRTTGKVRTAAGWGSGTMIGRRHVLTASHVVNWNRDAAGNIGWVTFTPGYFDGRGPWGELVVDEVLSWVQNPGTLTDQQTAFDYVVLVLRDPIGDTIGFAGHRTYQASWNGGAFWQCVGYAGNLAGGERPAYQGGGTVSSEQDFTMDVGGTVLTGAVLGHFNDFTPGQSGGPAWGWFGQDTWPSVIGVGSTIGSTAVEQPNGGTDRDNEYGGGPALASLVSWARENRP